MSTRLIPLVDGKPDHLPSTLFDNSIYDKETGKYVVTKVEHKNAMESDIDDDLDSDEEVA